MSDPGQPANPQTWLVWVSELVKYFGQFRALDGITFALQPGSATGLLGPNGAGKTTLLKTMLGFLSFSAGRISLFGQDVSTAPLKARQLIGYMPENDAAFPGMTGFEAVVLAGRLSGMPREAAFSRAYEVLDYLGMDEVRHRPQAGYSVGLKQKVKLGQALVHGPKLVFLDEPLNGLDPNSRDEMMGLLAGISRSGVALVISSHVLHDIESLCTEVLVLDCGRLLYSGPIERLGRSEKGRFRARIRGDEGAFVRLLEQGGGRAGRKGHLLDLTLPDGRGTALVFEAARQSGCQVRELLPARDSLEEAFLRLLGKEESS